MLIQNRACLHFENMSLDNCFMKRCFVKKTIAFY